MCADEQMFSLFIEYPVYCSHSAHNVTHGRVQNLNGFSIGFFCSHSAHNVTDGRIQNLNGFSIGFFCAHSAHNVTDGRIHRLPTSVGLAQARPNYTLENLHYPNSHVQKYAQVLRLVNLLYRTNYSNKELG